MHSKFQAALNMGGLKEMSNVFKPPYSFFRAEGKGGGKSRGQKLDGYYKCLQVLPKVSTILSWF